MEDHKAATSCVLLPVAVCATLLPRGKPLVSAAPLVDGSLKRTSTTALTHSPLPHKIRKTKCFVTILLFTQGDGSAVTGAQMTPAAVPDLRQLD